MISDWRSKVQERAASGPLGDRELLVALSYRGPGAVRWAKRGVVGCRAGATRRHRQNNCVRRRHPSKSFTTPLAILIPHIIM
jgi:hypothetical protein